MDNQYSKHFSENSLWDKIKKFSKEAGQKVIYVVLLLYYIMEDSRVPLKTKLSIAAALGYFILPTDVIFDVTPLVGFSDDLGVLLFTLSQVSKNITPEVKSKARAKLSDWFGEIDENELQDIEKMDF